MRLLFDQNLSIRLVDHLSDIFPNSTHTSREGLDDADDDVVWAYARDNELALVTKDADFDELATLRGAPPKIIWVRLGNCTTQQIEDLLRRQHPQILRFGQDPDSTILVLLPGEQGSAAR